ncbi:MAG: MFS transporter [Prevotella sp.]|nr:MFS transporter [Prevotella sp.]
MKQLSDSPVARWTVLIIVATAMMMGYFVNDVMSPLETLLEAPVAEGGLGWSPSHYGFFSGAGSFINVFLLMLFFSGLILDKMGVRFTGTLACSLMVGGVLIKLYGLTADFGSTYVCFFSTRLPMSVVVMSLGFAVFGVGYEMTGITVSKVMVRWFTGHELALAMGLQLAMARLGTAAALSLSAPVARHFTLSTPLLVSLAFLIIGLLAFLVFCVMDRRLDSPSADAGHSSSDIDEFRLRDIGLIVRSPGFWLITLFVVLFYSAVSPFLKFATKLLVVKYGVDADLAGFFTSIAPFGTMLLTPLFGSFYDRRGHGVTLVIIGTAMLAFVHFGFALPVHSSLFALSLMVILAIGYSLAPAALWPCVPKIIPLKCLGTAYSMIFFIQNFGRAVIPMVVGRANEHDPSYTSGMLVFAMTATAGVAVAVALLMADRRMCYGLQLPNIKKQH